MNYPEAVTVEYLDAKKIINQKLARLTTFQAFIVLLRLHGVSQTEIAEVCTEAGEEISRQGIQYQYQSALKKMGVWYQVRG